MIPLQGRTAVVSGAGNGLGQAIARALSATGVHVVGLGRDKIKLDATAFAVAQAGGSFEGIICDVTDEAAVRAVADRCGKSVSIVINNAGVGGPVKDLVDINLDEWTDVFTTNVASVFLMCKAFLPFLIEQGDADIINIASVTGKRPLSHRTPYAASKMAVIGLTRTLALEVGRTGVRVNTLSPGPVRGERMSTIFEKEAQRSGTTPGEAENAFVSRAAQHRLVQESEVADAVLAMLSMTGLCGADIDLSAGMIAP